MVIEILLTTYSTVTKFWQNCDKRQKEKTISNIDLSMAQLSPILPLSVAISFQSKVLNLIIRHCEKKENNS